MSAQDEELIYLIEHFWSPMHWRLRGAVIKRVTAMQQENATLRARVAELEARDDSDKRYAANCPNCGAPMRVIRPGDARCSAECYIKDVPDANT